MSRRASLPGASELFRRTSNPVFGDTPGNGSASAAPSGGGRGNGTSGGNGSGAGTGAGNGKNGGSAGAGSGPGRQRSLSSDAAARRGSGRQKHDAKITVYVSGDELLAMEHARLALRGTHDLVVDRGRLVREAVAVLLDDFEEHGEESVLVQRLRVEEAAEHAEEAGD